MKYFEAFGEGGFHAAFMTTYAFGSLAFEDIPFPKLRGAGCRNITVLADRAMVNQAFSEFGPPRFAGTSYHLIKVDAPGAFHPKITMLIGETKGRLIVGSANLTALGLGGNKEQLASIAVRAARFIKERERPPSITSSDAWERRLAEGAAAFMRFKKEGRYDG